MKQHRIEMILRATEPIAHHSETFGNAALIMREKMRFRHGFEDIPIITGDSMRHGLRRSSAYQYLHYAGLLDEPSLTQAALRLLLNGGVIQGASGGAVKLTEYREIAELVPMLRLLGGCAQNRTMDGRSSIDSAILICDETLEILPGWVGEFLADHNEATASHRSHVEEVTRVRMDAALSAGARELLLPSEAAEVEARLVAHEAASEGKDEKRKEDTKSSMHPRSFERVVRGSLWYWSQTFTTYSPLDEDTMWTMVLSFAMNVKVGGKKGTGHGAMEVAHAREFELAKPVESVEFALATKESGIGRIFRDHVTERRDRIRELLKTVVA